MNPLRFDSLLCFQLGAKDLWFLTLTGNSDRTEFLLGTQIINLVSSCLGSYVFMFEKGALVIRRIFSLVDMITKPKFSNCPNVFKNWTVSVVKYAQKASK